MGPRAAVTSGVLALLAGGCPADHAPGPRGEECAAIEDCNVERCGDLVPCIRGFCLASAPPVVVHCNDAGLDATRYECDFWDDCNPGRTCGNDLVACVRGICDPDAPPVRIPCDAGTGACGDDRECAVALSFDRCCGPCPEVVSRVELVADPCRYAADQIPAGRGPEDCYMDCMECVSCDSPPIGAICSGGTCAPIHGPCEDFVAGEVTVPTGEALARAAELLGRFITVSGTALAGDATCGEVGCDPGPRCRTPLLLDGAVEVGGSSCGVVAECTDAGCTDITCTPLSEGTRYDVSGFWRGGPVDYWLDLVSFQEG